MLEKYNINQTTLKILDLYRDNYAKSLHLREIGGALYKVDGRLGYAP